MGRNRDGSERIGDGAFMLRADMKPSESGWTSRTCWNGSEGSSRGAQIFSPPPFHMWHCNSFCFVFFFYFVLSLDSRDMYQFVLVQPIISLVSSSRWPPLNSALDSEHYNQEGQVTPEAKAHDQIRCVQLHNHISCFQSEDLAEKSLRSIWASWDKGQV